MRWIVCPSMLLEMLAATPMRFALRLYRDPDAIPPYRIRREPSNTFNGSTPEIQFTIDGHLQGRAVADATLVTTPCAVRGGIAGTFEGIADGASIVDTATGFVAWKGYGRIFSGNGPAGVARDGSILLVSTGGEFPIGAWIVKGDRKSSIGPVESASITADGTVWGSFRRSTGSRVEAFEWRKGRRRILGAWRPSARNARGTMVGYRYPPGRLEEPESLSLRTWVFWHQGRLQNLDFGRLGDPEEIFLQNDDSMFLCVHGAAGRWLYGWRRGRPQPVPGTIDGHRFDWRTAAVDRRGAFSAKDAAGRRWQIVRRR